jgi:tRNA pseudouridine55 synthase
MTKKDMFKKNEKKESGFILIDKPVGPTSFGVIARLRRITGIKKIGHAGTLDPAASGLLLCAIGREATRQISQFVKMDKEYEALVILGSTSDTLDREGDIIKSYQGPPIKIKEITKAVDSFFGKQEQTPPMFSAKKVGGQKLCDLARKGIEIKREPAKIEIYKIKTLKYKWPELRLRIKCSSGTYIRSIAADLGERLGCGAYLGALVRTELGEYKLKKAVSLEKTNQNNWRKLLFTVKYPDV